MGLSLIEAIKSGKRFRLPNKDCGWIKHTETSVYYFRGEDIVSNDWEIEEEKIEVTREQLREAWVHTNRGLPYFDDFARKLGFKE